MYLAAVEIRTREMIKILDTICLITIFLYSEVGNYPVMTTGRRLTKPVVATVFRNIGRILSTHLIPFIYTTTPPTIILTNTLQSPTKIMNLPIKLIITPKMCLNLIILILITPTIAKDY